MVGLIVVVIALSLGGGGSSAKDAQTRQAAARRQRAARVRTHPVTSVRVSYRRLYNLPAPLRDPAYATLSGGRFITLGGLDSADVSSSEIQLADTHGILHTGSLPAAQHDAQAAALGNAVYVFGGGNASELDHILRYSPSTGAVTQAGTLRAPQSDVAVAAAGGTAYVVGGYDGTNYLNTVVGWRPGSTPAVQARLPVGLRYAAVTVAGNALIIVGGSSPSGATTSIYRFDLATHRVTRIGALPHAITHANAATLDSTVYLVGGRGDATTSQTSEVWAINPATGHVTRAGRLPKPTSDAAVAAASGSIVVIGGLSGSSTLATVGELTPAPTG
ncbi:MAG TPA: kelch repeat-containing protein [Solirubrobacteraceae bacterium]|nr:kelch repeat-containing protein [Solirubrobacteraceae bacterium]